MLGSVVSYSIKMGQSLVSQPAKIRRRMQTPKQNVIEKNAESRPKAVETNASNQTTLIVTDNAPTEIQTQRSAPLKTPKQQKKPPSDLTLIIEGLLFASSKPLTVKHIQQLLSDTARFELEDIESSLQALKDDYQMRALELKQVASGYRFQIREHYSPWLAKLLVEKPAKYSRALLETLAIIAYRQPVTRGDIEDIRGVSVSSAMIQTLLEREWIKIVGQKEVPGRPNLYGTTPQFLDYFNLQTLNQLPTLQTISELDITNDNVTQLLQENREQQKQTLPV
jgi:segregation and condensation protein B